MYLYFIFVGPAILFAMWAQYKVKSSFNKYNRVGNSSGLTGAEAAATMLQGMGLQIVESAKTAQTMTNAVAIERSSGFLSDHYDPKKKVLRLSPKVYEGRSLSSVGVACHEAGHAIQHAQNYSPLELRNIMVPVVSIGSWAAFPIIILGAILSIYPLVLLGIGVFAALVVFQIITLPVEFNASKRAKHALLQLGVINGPNEQKGIAAVLDAAALTYVAAVVSSISTLIYYIMIFTGGRRG